MKLSCQVIGHFVTKSFPYNNQFHSVKVYMKMVPHTWLKERRIFTRMVFCSGANYM